MSYPSKSHKKFQRTEQRKKDVNREYKIYLFTKNKKDLFLCELIDYSSKGMCVRYNGIYDENMILKFSLTNKLEKIYIDFRARVRYRNNNYLGLEFMDFNPFNCF